MPPIDQGSDQAMPARETELSRALSAMSRESELALEQSQHLAKRFSRVLREHEPADDGDGPSQAIGKLSEEEMTLKSVAEFSSPLARQLQTITSNIKLARRNVEDVIERGEV